MRFITSALQWQRLRQVQFAPHRSKRLSRRLSGECTPKPVSFAALRRWRQPMARIRAQRSLGFPVRSVHRRGEADGPTAPNRSPGFPMQTHPRRTQCGVGADEPFVTNAECARARIPDAPLPRLRRGTRLRISGLSCFLLPTFLCSRQRKVGAAPHRGNANRPLTNQGKANAAGTQTTSAAQAKTQAKPNAAGLPDRRKKSHYMNPTLTYWSFPKNRPTIQPNTHREPEKTGHDQRQQEKNRRQAKPCPRPKGSTRMPAPPATRPVQTRAKQASSPAPRCKRKKPSKSESP